MLLKLLQLGFDPTKRNDRGLDLIHACFSGMDWPEWNEWLNRDKKMPIDTYRSREKIKMIFALAKHGAKWNPTDNSEINDIRRTLLKMKDDHTVEFVWIISKFKSCKRESVTQLLRTPTIRRHVAIYQDRISEIIRFIPNLLM